MHKDNKQKIAAVMHELLLKKSIDKITVKEVAELAGISRRAFYYHFTDILSVTEWLFGKKMEEITDIYSKASDFRVFLKLLAENIIEVYPEMKRLLDSKLRSHIEGIFIDTVRSFFVNISQKNGLDRILCTDRYIFLIDLLSHGIAGYFTEQCLRSNAFDTETFSTEVYRLINLRIRFEDTEK